MTSALSRDPILITESRTSLLPDDHHLSSSLLEHTLAVVLLGSVIKTGHKTALSHPKHICDSNHTHSFASIQSGFRAMVTNSSWKIILSARIVGESAIVLQIYYAEIKRNGPLGTNDGLSQPSLDVAMLFSTFAWTYPPPVPHSRPEPISQDRSPSKGSM